MVSLSASALEASALATDELVHQIQCVTNRRVSELRVDVQEGRIVVTGRSPTYYVKQLVTQAVRSRLPHVGLRNEVCVAAN